MNAELLAPAGSLECVKTALYFGADAVYLGGPALQLRAESTAFTYEALETAAALVHAKGKKLYVTVNCFARNDEIRALGPYARRLKDIGADAVIVSDLGAVAEIKEKCPEMEIYISTQANAMNYRTVQVYKALGASRVVLAREMTLAQIEELRGLIGPDMELETFVHGAMCMAYSGRCLLSSFLANRSGNRGECAQTCRWVYHVMEEQRPGEYMPVTEDDRGTYIFSARDLNLMPLLPGLCEAGVSSLKIEGRMKTEYYVGVVTGAYRRGLDLLAQGREAFDAALPTLLAELKCASHRLSDTGFLLGPPEKPAGATGFSQTREYVARALADSGPGETAEFLLKNRFCKGDPLELMTPEGVVAFEAPAMTLAATGETVNTHGVANAVILLPMPCRVQAGDMLRGPVRNHSRVEREEEDE